MVFNAPSFAQNVPLFANFAYIVVRTIVHVAVVDWLMTNTLIEDVTALTPPTSVFVVLVVVDTLVDCFVTTVVSEVFPVLASHTLVVIV